MTLTEIFAFFNKDKPCPEEIEGCEELRTQYFKEINDVHKGCANCNQVAVRDKFVNILLKK